MSLRNHLRDLHLLRPTIAFRDTLKKQHDDADAHGDSHRQQVFAKILSDHDETAS